MVRSWAGCDAREYHGAEDRASRRRERVWQVEGSITRLWVCRLQLLGQEHSSPDSNGDGDGEACALLR